ncbi:hypothetical protein QJS10_CPA16g01561 [Acorus calamus]|uniref:Uncharacterized protein n=1 Tax=Acorus calamus TaxID=4465 RepID=A0AAV9D1J1_ACOCL|nr:hypothetical protein QJS10_CPA16g01561 [Acorus calamus]
MHFKYKSVPPQRRRKLPSVQLGERPPLQHRRRRRLMEVLKGFRIRLTSLNIENTNTENHENRRSYDAIAEPLSSVVASPDSTLLLHRLVRFPFYLFVPT